jgi:hypothetical protein
MAAEPDPEDAVPSLELRFLVLSLVDMKLLTQSCDLANQIAPAPNGFSNARHPIPE